jgi:peroxiredoxin
MVRIGLLAAENGVYDTDISRVIVSRSGNSKLPRSWNSQGRCSVLNKTQSDLHPRSSRMRPDIVPGGTFSDYELPDHTNTPRRLSELQGSDPLILTLARGHYCPKEHQQHLELAAFYPKIAVAYTQIATIATDDHHTLQEFRASVGAQWTFLSDPDRKVQKDLDIREYTDPEHNPMIPHTLVLKPGLVIHSIYNGYWFWGRPSVVDLWHDLRTVTSQIRPDWDLSTPGLREAWNAGDFSRFHGWNKRAV